MISFVNALGSVKIRLACSKALLLTVLSSNIVTHSNGYIKGGKYFFFYKSRCGKFSPEMAMYKNRNTGLGNGMRGMGECRQTFRRMS